MTTKRVRTEIETRIASVARRLTGTKTTRRLAKTEIEAKIVHEISTTGMIVMRAARRGEIRVGADQEVEVMNENGAEAEGQEAPHTVDIGVGDNRHLKGPREIVRTKGVTIDPLDSTHHLKLMRSQK